MDGVAKSGGRVDTIQALRGLAALLVVFVHATNTVDYRTDVKAGPAFDWLGFNCFGAIGVDIFFVISGFAMSEALRNRPDRPAGEFLVDRFVRILPLFWVASLLTALVFVPLGIEQTRDSLANSITLFPLFDPVTYHTPLLFVGWSLAFEFAFYTVVAAVLLVKGGNRLPLLLMAVLLLAIPGSASGERPDLQEIWVNAIWFEFAAGIGLNMAFRGGLFERKPWLAPFLLIAGLSGFVWSIYNDISYIESAYALFRGQALDRIIWWGLPAMAFTAGAVGVGEAWLARRHCGNKAWRGALQMGDASYSLYLVHMIPIILIERLLPVFPWRGEWLIGGLILASIALAMPFHRFVERPLLAWCKRQLAKWKEIRSAKIASGQLA